MDAMNRARPMQEPVAHTPMDVMAPRSSGGMLNKLLMVALLVAALGLIGFFGVRSYHALTADSAIKSKEYQALFLSNGQVYFCKLAQVDASYVKCTDIYYLQVQQQVQPTDKNSSQSPQVSLAKLGGELHGPEDMMYVSRSQVLFWENLKNDGKVAKAIADYKAQGNK